MKYVYHYTSLDALRSILGSEICLWATKYKYLNDPSEKIWAEKYVLEAIKKMDGFQQDTSIHIQNWLSKDAYILSLCSKGDDRNMWRLYSNDGKGVCLILDREVLLETCWNKMCKDANNNFVIVENVEYAKPEGVEKAIKKCLNKEAFNIMDEELESRLMRIAPFIKNADFKIENEIRCAILREFGKISMSYDEISNRPGKETVEKNYHNVKYRMRGNELIPYIEIKLPAKALKGITLGYEVEENVATDYINSIISDNMEFYRGLKILKSKRFSSADKNNYNKLISEH